MTAKTVRGATARRLSALLSLLGVAGANAAPAPPAEDRSPLAQADGPRVLAETADAWNIGFVESTTDLNGTGTDQDQIVLEYDIGKGDIERRIIRPMFFAKGCKEDVVGVNATANMNIGGKNATHDTLSVSYDVTPSALTGSNLWNSVTNAIEYCHVLKLFLYKGDDMDKFIDDDDFETGWWISVAYLSDEYRDNGDLSLARFDETEAKELEENYLEISSDTREFTLKILTSFNFTLGVRGGDDPLGMGMRILGWVNFTNFAAGELANDVVASTVDVLAQNATSAMGQGQTVTSAQVITNAEENGGSAYYFELLLDEPCHLTPCTRLVNETTMFENVTDYLALVLVNGEFLDAFRVLWSGSPDANRALSAPAEGEADPSDAGGASAAAPVEGSAVVDPVRRLQDGVVGYIEPKPPGADYPNGMAFKFMIFPEKEEPTVASDQVSLAEFIKACRCDAETFVCDESPKPLSPNDELGVCIRSTSTDIQIDKLDSVVLIQETSELPLIANDEVLVKAITQREYIGFQNGVAVTTRVPSNLFKFAAGRSLTLSGTVRTKLAGRRELLALGAGGGGSPQGGDGRSLQADDEEAAFELDITLTGEEGTPELATLSSSAGVAKKGIVATGAAFGVVYNLW